VGQWGLAVAWSDSGARTGPHEIGLIARIASRNDSEEAARRLYRKYCRELSRFGVHVLRDQGLAKEMVQETFICWKLSTARWVPEPKMPSTGRVSPSSVFSFLL
jgi:hypothetical protein